MARSTERSTLRNTSAVRVSQLQIKSSNKDGANILCGTSKCEELVLMLDGTGASLLLETYASRTACRGSDLRR